MSFCSQQRNMTFRKRRLRFYDQSSLSHFLMNENIASYDLDMISSSHDRSSWLHSACCVAVLEHCFNDGCLKWPLLAYFINKISSHFEVTLSRVSELNAFCSVFCLFSLYVAFYKLQIFTVEGSKRTYVKMELLAHILVLFVVSPWMVCG